MAAIDTPDNARKAITKLIDDSTPKLATDKTKLSVTEESALSVIRDNLEGLYKDNPGAIEIKEGGRIAFNEKAKAYLDTQKTNTNLRNASNAIKESSLIGDNMAEAIGGAVGMFGLGKLLEEFLPSWIAKPLGALIGVVGGALFKVFALGDTAGYIPKLLGLNPVVKTEDVSLVKVLKKGYSPDKDGSVTLAMEFEDPTKIAATDNKLANLGTVTFTDAQIAELKLRKIEVTKEPHTIVGKVNVLGKVTEFIIADKNNKRIGEFKNTSNFFSANDSIPADGKLSKDIAGKWAEHRKNDQEGFAHYLIKDGVAPKAIAAAPAVEITAELIDKKRMELLSKPTEATAPEVTDVVPGKIHKDKDVVTFIYFDMGANGSTVARTFRGVKQGNDLLVQEFRTESDVEGIKEFAPITDSLNNDKKFTIKGAFHPDGVLDLKTVKDSADMKGAMERMTNDEGKGSPLQGVKEFVAAPQTPSKFEVGGPQFNM